MATSASLGDLEQKQAAYNFYVMQLNYWSQKYEANSEKLQKQEGYYTKWESAYDDAQNADKVCKIGNQEWKGKDTVLSDAEAERYANAKVTQYDEALSLELASLDIDFDATKTMFETLVTEIKAQIDSQKSQVAASAQDTHLLGQ